MTALTRLTELLKWPNGDFDEWTFTRRSPSVDDSRSVKKKRLTPQEPDALSINRVAIRKLLDAFVRSFDGSPDAGFVVAEADDRAGQIGDDELDALGVLLHTIVMCGLDPTLQGRIGLDGFPTPSLRFTVLGAGRQESKWRPTKNGNLMRVGGAAAKSAYRAPGAYVLKAMGTTADLVPFLVAHLLTQRDMVAIRRCKRRLCDRFVVINQTKRGHRPEYCEPLCSDLEDKEKQLQQRAKKS
jgi:hypothetical protein